MKGNEKWLVILVVAALLVLALVLEHPIADQLAELLLEAAQAVVDALLAS